jgi:hypothetical protein
MRCGFCAGTDIRRNCDPDVDAGRRSVIFSIVDRVLLQPLPFRDPDRLFEVPGRLTGAGINAVKRRVL